MPVEMIWGTRAHILSGQEGDARPGSVLTCAGQHSEEARCQG
jgi:hypothetical protein